MDEIDKLLGLDEDKDVGDNHTSSVSKSKSEKTEKTTSSAAELLAAFKTRKKKKSRDDFDADNSPVHSASKDSLDVESFSRTAITEVQTKPKDMKTLESEAVAVIDFDDDDDVDEDVEIEIVHDEKEDNGDGVLMQKEDALKIMNALASNEPQNNPEAELASSTSWKHHEAPVGKKEISFEIQVDKALNVSDDARAQDHLNALDTGHGDGKLNADGSGHGDGSSFSDRSSPSARSGRSFLDSFADRRSPVSSPSPSAQPSTLPSSSRSEEPVSTTNCTHHVEPSVSPSTLPSSSPSGNPDPITEQTDGPSTSSSKPTPGPMSSLGLDSKPRLDSSLLDGDDNRDGGSKKLAPISSGKLSSMPLPPILPKTRPGALTDLYDSIIEIQHPDDKEPVVKHESNIENKVEDTTHVHEAAVPAKVCE